MTTGTKADPTPAQSAQQSIVIVRDFTPGQVVRVIFLTPDQAKSLPTIPTTALQIAVFPAGNS